MRYFLQNIAQSNPIRTIILVLIGFALWIISLTQQSDMVAILVSLALAGVNSLLLSHVFCKGCLTNLPSSFAASSYWVAISATPILHSGWQIQVVIFSILTIVLILSGIKYQNEATEESFLATLICCFLSPTRITLVIGIVVLWIYLIIRGWMTWRVLAASLIAIVLRLILMILLHYFGWMKWIWMENIPTLPWQEWTIAGGVLIGTLLVILLPIRRPSIASGSVYAMFLLALLTIGSLSML